MPLFSECTYCGLPAEELDHIVPRAYTGEGIRQGVVTPACRQCNRTLSDRMYTCVPDRAAFLCRVYLAKYRSILDMPQWTHEELNEMGPRLRRRILRALQARVIIRARLAYLERVASLPPPAVKS